MITRAATIDVRLRATWLIGVGYRYDVIFGEETIVSQSRDPEYDAARALQDRGLSGKFRTIDFVTGMPRMILDIEKAAGLRTVERAVGGPPVVVAFQPMSEADKIRVFTHRLHQGRVFPEWTGESPVEAIEAPGDKTGAASRRVLVES